MNFILNTMEMLFNTSTGLPSFSIIKLYRRKEFFNLKIHISTEAADWYKDELYLKDGDFVRFFARYGGFSSVQQGFSLGLSNDKPEDIGAKEEVNGVTYYIEDRDLWYFDDLDLYIDFNAKNFEPEFRISK